MDLGPVRALALDINFSVYGVPATVTRPSPDTTPVVTSGIWLTELDEQAPGSEFPRREPRRVLVVPRNATLPTAPRGTLVQAAERVGDVVKTWRVDGLAQPVAVDHWRLIIVPA